MGELADLPNLGPKSETMLLDAGVTSVEQLHKLGAVRAYSLVKATGGKVSVNLLWALEGALTGVAWQKIAQDHRLSLLLALEESVPKNSTPAQTESRAKLVRRKRA